MSVAVHSPLLHDRFYLPLSTEAYNQFLVFSNEIQGLQLSHSSDIWTYTWGSSSFFSNKAYAILIGHQQVHPVFNWLWRSACQNKWIILFWLVLKDRLSTRALLRRRNMFLPDYIPVFSATRMWMKILPIFCSIALLPLPASQFFR